MVENSIELRLLLLATITIAALGFAEYQWSLTTLGSDERKELTEIANRVMPYIVDDDIKHLKEIYGGHPKEWQDYRNPSRHLFHQKLFDDEDLYFIKGLLPNRRAYAKFVRGSSGVSIYEKIVESENPEIIALFPEILRPREARQYFEDYLLGVNQALASGDTLAAYKYSVGLYALYHCFKDSTEFRSGGTSVDDSRNNTLPYKDIVQGLEFKIAVLAKLSGSTVESGTAQEWMEHAEKVGFLTGQMRSNWEKLNG